MPIPIPVKLVELILLGPLDDRRQLQDSPILGDVWIAYGKSPAAALDLLISPYLHENAGKLAARIHREVVGRSRRVTARVAYMQGLVAARLTFAQLLRHVVPLTHWWREQWPDEEAKDGAPVAPQQHPVLRLLADEAALRSMLEKTLTAVSDWLARTGGTAPYEVPSTHRFLTLAGLILWASDARLPKGADLEDGDEPKVRDLLSWVDRKRAARRLHELPAAAAEDRKRAAAAAEAEKGGERAEATAEAAEPGAAPARESLVYLVSLNRTASPAIERSVPAVKADAAHTLFKVSCRDISWAVLDSGIHGGHPAFQGKDAKGQEIVRVKASYDFRNLRSIISLDNLRRGARKQNVAEILKRGGDLVDPPTDDQAHDDLERLARDAVDLAPIRWELVQRYVRIRPEVRPSTPHGTHVAGILGGCPGPGGEPGGMCPDIGLYDFRILGRGIEETEFAIIAAMQFIRYLNERGSVKAIHGVNLSLSIPHDVRNFACGRTPICNEAERLVDSGVVVVAAAGNHGYKNFHTAEGPYAGYAAFSITDPGNADSVITVGATHRFWPHTFGVSYFSSRGPTGDGRVKPDLVAPGERIRAPLDVGDDERPTWGELDGTSMAAPHVSGAAAMLMGRYSELIEQPRRVKQILCASATDLGRERTFQGHGMLDVLRAFQSL